MSELEPRQIVGKPKTGGYAAVQHTWWTRPRDLPPFTFHTIQSMLLEPTVRLGLAMRLAFIQGMEIAYKEGKTWTKGIKCDDERMADWAERTLRRFWEVALWKVGQAQVWGWSAGEVLWRYDPETRLLEFDDYLDRHAMDVEVLEKDSRPQGVRFLRCAGAKNGYVDLCFPKAFWHAHLPEAGTLYGQSILRGCYSPWADKWLNGGANDVRRLFMHKDAYGGGDLTYPDGTTYVEGVGDVPNRDIARQIVEQYQSGSVTTRPWQPGPDGKNQWELQRATIPGNPQHILQYPKDLDSEILRGMEIPDDVLSADNSGAWEGKKVPMTAFLASLDTWGTALLRDVQRYLLEPGAYLNFGKYHMEVSHIPLVEQIMGGRQDQQRPSGAVGGNPQGPGNDNAFGMGGQQPQPGAAEQRMALAAIRAVKAARKVFKMGSARAPKGGVTVQGTEYKGGEFIPSDVMARATPEEKAKVKGQPAPPTPPTVQSPLTGE